jgi:hypothetical protein
MIANCCSPDTTERKTVHDILRKLYSKALNYKDQILLSLKNMLHLQRCSSELLDFFNKIAVGFQSPLQPFHEKLFTETLLPLHSATNMNTYCVSLLQALTTFIKLEPQYFKATFLYLVKHWPYTIIKKQLVYLTEMEGLIIAFPKLFDFSIARILLNQINYVISQPSVDLAIGGVNLLLRPLSERLLIDYLDLCIESKIGSLSKTVKGHWNAIVKGDTLVALKVFTDISQELFQKNLEGITEESKRFNSKCKITIYQLRNSLASSNTAENLFLEWRRTFRRQINS